MFEKLKEVAAPTAINAAYATVHVLRRRSTKKGIKIFVSPTGAAPLKGEVRLVEGLVDEIIKAEGKPLGMLSDKDISKYVGSLTGIAQNRVKVTTTSPEKIRILWCKLDKAKPGPTRMNGSRKTSPKKGSRTFKSAARATEA
jgi:hypothetical protein